MLSIGTCGIFWRCPDFLERGRNRFLLFRSRWGCFWSRYPVFLWRCRLWFLEPVIWGELIVLWFCRVVWLSEGYIKLDFFFFSVFPLREVAYPVFLREVYKAVVLIVYRP
jgi:hypothetical protein